MLDSMRRNANSWVFSLVFAVIIFVFAINFGPWAGRLGSEAPIFAAEVNGRIIGVKAFQSDFSGLLRQTGLSQEDAEKRGLGASFIINKLIDRELLAQLADSNNLTVTKEDLLAFVKKNYLDQFRIPIEKEDDYNKFINDYFQMEAGEFDALQTRIILATRMVDMLKTGIHISDADLKAVFEMMNDKVSVDYIRISPAHFEVLPADKVELEKWSNDHESEMKIYYETSFPQVSDPKVHASPKSFAEVKTEIATKLWLQEKQTQNAQNYAMEIIGDLRKGTTLDKVAPKDLIRTPEGSKPLLTEIAPVFASTSLFAKTEVFGQGLTREVAAEAFKLSSEDPFAKEPISSNGNIYVVALKERKKPEESQFDLVKESLRSYLTDSRANELQKSYVAHLRKKAKIEINPALVQLSTEADS